MRASGAGAAGQAVRVSVVEDHRLQRERTVEILTERAGLRVVSTHESLPDFVAWLRVTPAVGRPGLLVLDLAVDRGPDADPGVVRAIVDAGIRVIVISALASPRLVRAMIRSGVGAFVSKRDTTQDILTAVSAVLDGGDWATPDVAAIIASDPLRPRLSAQEERAIILYASGLTLDAVATRMGVKPDTAKQYIQRARQKYAALGRDVRTKVDLFRAVQVDGLMPAVTPVE